MQKVDIRIGQYCNGRFDFEPFGCDLLRGFWKFAGTNGREQGIIALFVLHSLQKEPKSGYDILKEIEERTGGRWVPSKGTLYPVLRHLEEDGLIGVLETGRRGKSIYGTTPAGEEMLRAVRRHRQESHKRLVLFKDLFVEIFGDSARPLDTLLFEVRCLTDALPSERQEEAAQILERTCEELRRIDADERHSC
ncbi:PadR family transcriptional regulator [Methanofollis fontis]|uniref:PadR family transcriptional regulator n=1 Tax=Methanofollis fontis TaxID=2052832 RepID=A0A483CZF0_9EURY|nr:PadR family transcriptional regulator [Methanofollis fontis]TAJ45459.1 PadR family transcriptional regulator [Methanofollis fontis]